jgi:eukaryotic-like serine/threonine-protein kinase
MSAAPGAARWDRLEQLFYAALALPALERTQFLERECADDVALRAEVDSLLAFSGKTLQELRKPVDEAAQHLASEEAGQQIGPYRLTRLIGEGGMGQVYLARRADKLYEQEVAIKLMHAGLKQAQSMLSRFSAERQILANLNHPNIARLLDAGITSDGAPYLVMEYIAGTRIDEYCRAGGLPPKEVLKLLLPVFSAVEYAHKSLVVHRDIKPANILVTSGGVPKLPDFGIAKLLDPDGEDARTITAERMMTPEYASPEQVRGDHVTTSTDVYALGVLLYELLTGERPFRLESRSPLEVVQVICEQQPQPPSLVGRSSTTQATRGAGLRIDRDLDNLVLMAMRKEPARRYVSVSALSADVQAYLSGYPVHARTDHWSYRSGKFVLRHKAAVGAAAIVAIALVAFSIAMGVMARRANQARLTAERETQFLNSIFQAATPEEARGKAIMARDLLDQGAKRIDSELAEQPALQATMLDNIGRAYSALGLYPQAQSLLQRAFDIRRRLEGQESLDTASTEEALGNVVRLQNQFQQAEPLFRDSLAVREKRLGRRDRLVAESLDSLGECLYLQDRFAEAEPLLRRALAIHRSNANDYMGGTENYLALLLERKGNFPEAAQLLREAVQVGAKSRGTDSPDYLISLHDYAGALIDSGNLDEAEATERQVLALREKISGPDHPDIFYALNNLGFILLEKGEWQQATPFLARNLELCHKLGNDKRIAVALNNWARALQQKGDYAAAEATLKQALQEAHAMSGENSSLSAKIVANQGLLELDRRDYAAAENYARHALNTQSKVAGKQTPAYASALIDLAEDRLFQGDASGAEPLLQQALAIREQKFNAGNPAIIAAQVRLGEDLTQEGKLPAAETVLRQALASAKAEPFPLPPWKIAEAESALGACLLAGGHPAEAAQLLRRSEQALLMNPQAALRIPADVRYAKVRPPAHHS